MRDRTSGKLGKREYERQVMSRKEYGKNKSREEST